MSNSELDNLCENPVPPFTLQGEPVVLEPLKVRQLTVAAEKLTAVFRGLALEKLSGDDLLAAILARVDEAKEFLALASDKPVEWIDELTGDEFFRLFAKVQEVNHDFFFLTLRRMMQAARAAEAAGLDGPMPSSSLSPTATTSGPSPIIPLASSEPTSEPAEEWNEAEAEID